MDIEKNYNWNGFYNFCAFNMYTCYNNYEHELLELHNDLQELLYNSIHPHIDMKNDMKEI